MGLGFALFAPAKAVFLMDASFFALIAVDIGNNRIKLGRFDSPWNEPLPEPTDTISVDGRNPDLDRVAAWLSDPAAERAAWWIGSVNRPTTTLLLDWLRLERPNDRVTLLAAGDLALKIAVERPDMVGIDRLLDALAVNRIRAPERPAVVVDVGSAITVDLVSRDGVFLGGAILPGIAMSARALHEFTDLLPLVDMAELSTPPPALGTSTIPAMRSGLFWGAVGAIRQLVECLTTGGSGEPQVFLSGGAGPAVASLLGQSTRHVPHLTLGGIALAAAGGTAGGGEAGRNGVVE
ncbi:MAG: type III pantothenate kinase [Pirellulales bacterium]|nr:type III pantothenate kinase [Pirellulales bacterium]